MYDARLSANMTAKDLLGQRDWSWPDGWTDKFPILLNMQNLRLDMQTRDKSCGREVMENYVGSQLIKPTKTFFKMMLMLNGGKWSEHIPREDETCVPISSYELSTLNSASNVVLEGNWVSHRGVGLGEATWWNDNLMMPSLYWFLCLNVRMKLH
ncbi:hypothetical protein Tco_1244061 [Tanacetum coccineum]